MRPSRRRIPGKIEDLRVLHIGGYWRGPNDMVYHMMLGLRRTGACVSEYNIDDRPEAFDTEGRPYDRGRLGPVWLREEYLKESIARFKPHLVVCNAGGLSFRPEAAKELRRQCRLIGIALSDPDVFEPATRFIAQNFDLFLTNDRNLVPEYLKLGVHAAPLPLGTNEDYWRTLPPLEKYGADVLVIGRAHPDRIGPVKAITERFRTIVFGEGWEEQGIKSSGFIYGDETLHALNSAKIVPLFLTNPDGSTMYVKTGVLDFVSAGALLITNYLPDIEQYLAYDKEIIGFASTEELIDRIGYYLSHPEEAKAIRKAGQSRVRRQHTWTSVWPRILSMIDA